MTSRRDFLKMTMAVTASAVLPACHVFNNETWWVSCCTNKQGEHFAAALNQNGELINLVALPARGHQIIAAPNRGGRALIFARRPGTYLMEVDFQTGEIINQISSEAGFHFYGHGVVSADNSVFFTTENDHHNDLGMVVVRDAQTLKPVDKFLSGGVGPHELKLMPDNKTLVIANGGIKTHPSQPRKKLNLASMQPNLTYLSTNNGQIVGQYEVDNKQLSIRHLDVSQSGKVVIGMQYQGAKNDLTKLVYCHQGEDSLTSFNAPESIWRRMNQYTASVAVNSSEDKVAIACPRGNMMTYWQLSSGQFIQAKRISDGAGVTLNQSVFVATNGKGQVFSVNHDSVKLIKQHNSLKWDNHLNSIELV